MLIIFQNPGLIDLRAVQIMGLNAKDSKNPIGQFGTGLKYAIAVLLRTGCKVSIFRGEDEYGFTTSKEEFRGKTFDFVKMQLLCPAGHLENLGFTLELGKHWEPWMAIRELESNCRDEGGESFADADYQLSPTATTIVVSGTSTETAYATLGDIFLQSKPLWANAQLEVHRAQNPEQLKWLYYRGVRVASLENPALYRYNILHPQMLTEDRTLRYSWTAVEALTQLGQCNNEEVLDVILNAEKTNFEWQASFNENYLSDKFIEATLALGTRALPSAWKVVRRAKGFAEFEEIQMDEMQLLMLSRAYAFIEKMGETRVRTCKVKVTADLGAKHLGVAMHLHKEIWLSTRVFEMGMKQLISCLYEEFIHLDRKLIDLDYEMQNFLFDTIITQAAKLQGEIL